ncbi:hypothetical protein DB30_05943 [Enhygromyxa salina]|uniref:Uncharacterized protein n=1 Tax=Enhygromyxa salina TaxID=215803 RepID=A0A0C1ZNJ0_9BACT|nr:hypothetical protein DB30_05943 [Enhygromyxa salina]
MLPSTPRAPADVTCVETRIHGTGFAESWQPAVQCIAGDRLTLTDQFVLDVDAIYAGIFELPTA